MTDADIQRVRDYMTGQIGYSDSTCNDEHCPALVGRLIAEREALLAFARSVQAVADAAEDAEEALEHLAIDADAAITGAESP